MACCTIEKKDALRYMAMYVIEHLQRNEFNYLTMSEYMKMSRVDVVISVY